MAWHSEALVLESIDRENHVEVEIRPIQIDTRQKHYPWLYFI